MKPNPIIDPQTLSIDLGSKTEAQLFRWFLASLLFGKPIQQTIARRAYHTLIAADITSIDKLAKIDWDTLVRLLDQAHYVRYDFSTATKLIQIATQLKTKYGSLSQLLQYACNTHKLEAQLLAFNGIGPTTTRIFMQSIGPLWFEQTAPHDYESAIHAAAILRRHKFTAYIIGGAVRDLWLGTPPKDFDLVTDATPKHIMGLREFTHAQYHDTSQAYGVTRVQFVHKGNPSTLEIATFRKDIDAHHGRRATKITFASLEDDVLRRDFTINALAYDPATGFVIDYVNGINDLEHRLIRFIGNPIIRIHEDPLRLMRAVRFKNQLGFDYHPDTVKAIQTAVSTGVIETIAIDRLRDELTRLLIHPSRHKAFRELDTYGILARVLPEVTAGKGVRQPPQLHAEGDVWQHELLTLHNLPPHPSTQLAWAALLHDIGKAPTKREPRQKHDRIRFDRHYAVGAELATTLLRRLRFSTRDTRNIVWMIYHHLSIDDLPNMRPSHQQHMLGHPAFQDLLELHRADAAASWRSGETRHRKPAFRAIERLWHHYQTSTPEIRQPSLKRDIGIDGNWLLTRFAHEFDLTNRSVIGTVLRALDNWYRDEGVTDEQAYIERTRQLLIQHDTPKLVI